MGLNSAHTSVVPVTVIVVCTPEAELPGAVLTVPLAGGAGCLVCQVARPVYPLCAVAIRFTVVWASAMTGAVFPLSVIVALEEVPRVTV